MLKHNKELQAILWMVCNCFMAASILSLTKYIAPNIYLSNLVAGYYFSATSITLIYIMYSGHSLKTPHIYLHFIRSFMSTVAYFLYFYALSITSLANVVALGYTDGILTCFFSFLLLKESFTRNDILHLILSFIGALMIIGPNGDIINLGAAYAGCSALLWALSNIITKIIAKTDDSTTQLFYSNFFTFLIAFIIAIYNGDIKHILSIYNAKWFLIVGAISTIQYYALFKSLSTAKTSVIMPFFVSTVIFVNIYGYFFFYETQNIRELLGTFLVIFVGLTSFITRLRIKY